MSRAAELSRTRILNGHETKRNVIKRAENVKPRSWPKSIPDRGSVDRTVFAWSPHARGCLRRERDPISRKGKQKKKKDKKKQEEVEEHQRSWTTLNVC